jgi:hypothetical protein
MVISFQCPNCNKAYRVKDNLAGKRAPCGQCQAVMTVPQPTADPTHAHAVESLAKDLLSDEPAEPAAAAGGAIALECPFCFEQVTFPPEKGGKQSPCPACRKIIRVPVPATGKPKADWRAVENNFTMARRDTEAAPEGAWGAAQNQSVVSREALREAKVVFDRKDLAAPNRKPIYITAAVAGLTLAAAVGWWGWGRWVEGQRVGLVADALKASEPKKAPGAWPAGVFAAAGEFWLREPQPDLKAAAEHFRQARSLAQAAESEADKAELLLHVALGQASLVGDEAAADARRALGWEDSQRELRQTLQNFGGLPREHAWLAVEELTRRLGSVGPKRPVVEALAPNALPSEADRAEALACVGLVLAALKDPQAAAVLQSAQDAATAMPGAPPSPRLVALLRASGQGDAAGRMMPAPTSGDPGLPARLGYAEGFARAGEVDQALRVAQLPGPDDHRAQALALVADGHPEGLEPAVKFVAEHGQKFTLPAWVPLRIARACERGGRADLARQLATGVAQMDVKPWLELTALRAELAASTSAAEPPDLAGDRSPAEALAAVFVGRHNARVSAANPRAAVSAWALESTRPAGLVGSALGLQDRRR